MDDSAKKEPVSEEETLEQDKHNLDEESEVSGEISDQKISLEEGESEKEEEKEKEYGDEEEEKNEVFLEEKDDSVTIAQQNKVLGWILVVIVMIFVGIFSFQYFDKPLSVESSDGALFDVINENGLLFYHTSFVIQQGNNVRDYNVYFRTSPKILDSIPFEGDVARREMLVLNNSDPFNCEGRGVIAIANMAQILGAMGTQAITDPEATCDEEGRYTFVHVREGEETMIEQFGPSCYYLTVNDCEILEVTEKYVLEQMKDAGVL